MLISAPLLPTRLLLSAACLGLLLAAAGTSDTHAATARKKSPGVRLNPAESPPATEPSAISVLPGFKVELVYSVPRTDQGSWVALTTDPKGRILASDQYGAIDRITPPPLGTSTGSKIEKLDLDLRKITVAGPAAEPGTKKKETSRIKKV